MGPIMLFMACLWKVPFLLSESWFDVISDVILLHGGEALIAPRLQ